MVEKGAKGIQSCYQLCKDRGKLLETTDNPRKHLPCTWNHPSMICKSKQTKVLKEIHSLKRLDHTSSLHWVPSRKISVEMGCFVSTITSTSISKSVLRQRSTRGEWNETYAQERNSESNLNDSRDPDDIWIAAPPEMRATRGDDLTVKLNDCWERLPWFSPDIETWTNLMVSSAA